jgi:menaquinone-dependent protoporphyrinogen oxidase
VNVLIAYGTTEGQTRKIAEWAAKYIRERDHLVELTDSSNSISGLSLDEFQAFIVAASVHQEQHQGTIKNFAAAHRELLNSQPSALISVSLSAVLEETRPDAQKYVDHFISLTGWQPHMTLLLGGALRFTEYDYFQEQIVKFIVMKRAVPASGEHDREFTDWGALGCFLEEFLDIAMRHSNNR